MLFNKIILNLKDINVKIKDEEKIIIFLSSLPPSYEHFINTLLYERHTLTIEDAKEALSLKKKSSKRSQIRDGEGLIAKGKSEKKDG